MRKKITSRIVLKNITALPYTVVNSYELIFLVAKKRIKLQKLIPLLKHSRIVHMRF